ncbi:anhydro-N-acetylmuramic acid kinase [Flavitalea sp. BT771]|uniref:anhydro-N-acetylmuramic acid kinase n=1 Tax=Flavitalea sp. BT771 TaxID=3063329 RepID=UPI0026E1EB4F|nr:anhydro-N-acetylmuramic acid kinase [Flavitalea sp. BT771]MDO6432959.1 anhydro-N-acetylmuramic acid kinase [Flavitalea sp. BT771]MDV6221765.1 anhydro-N-acetylmuramic acid kinase [Flavitalea sp. BT771]
MVYKVIGLMSGSSLDGLDIAYVHLQESPSTKKEGLRKWEYSILWADCYPYSSEWRQTLASAGDLSAFEYQVLHTRYGHYLGEQVLRFIEEHNLHYQVQLVASHGHTTFHSPEHKMTAQLGDGAALAATAKINVVSDLRAMDVALGGQGAPIVPVGERLLLQDYTFFLNLGGIANISAHFERRAASDELRAGSNELQAASDKLQADQGRAGSFVAFDVCPANRVLNELALLAGMEYDAGGELASRGQVLEGLLQQLDGLAYYGKPYPKSLPNEFGTETVLPLIREAIEGKEGEGVDQGAEGGISIEDALRTYVEHVARQVVRAASGQLQAASDKLQAASGEVRASSGELQAASYKLQAETGEASGGGGGKMLVVGNEKKMLVTGGGVHNTFLVGRLRALLAPLGIEVVVPDGQLADYKEALVMALIGVLRWREENNVFASVTGASRDSIGGAVWIGQEA